MLPDMLRQFIRADLLPRTVKVDQEEAGDKISVVCPETGLVHIVRQLRLSRLFGSREEVFLHVSLPERAQRIDDQDVRVKVKDAVQALRQELP